MKDLVKSNQGISLTERIQSGSTPALFSADRQTAQAFWEFFVVNYRNANTREAYLRAGFRFADWCEQHELSLYDVEPVHVSAYVETMINSHSLATVKLHLSALKKLFAYLIVNQIMASNPAMNVATPRLVIEQGSTPQLEPAEIKSLFASIKLDSLAGYRDRAIIATMVYSFARVSAVCRMDGKDFYTQGTKSYYHLLEKGNKKRRIPVHHSAQQYLIEYIEYAGISEDRDLPLFRKLQRYDTHTMTTDRLNRNAVWKMIKRRCAAIGLPPEITNHSFRGTGITTFIKHGGTLEAAARIAGHANPSTTKLYDRSNDETTLDDIERIQF